ncbi:MAG: DUF4340 domain-containing protein [Desulfobacterales bacterium]|nr:DUF4340 domain-containing protein [Desulfobacterales bacterium]
MKSKKEYIILIAVAAVLVLYLVFHQSDRTLYELPEMPDLSEKELSRLEIKTPDETIELERKAGKWILKPQGDAAADGKIEKMIETVKNFKLTAMVSASETYTRYQLADENKISVKAWADGELIREFDIGKTAPSHRHTFVKLPDDPNVYHARNNFRNRFDQSPAALRDKTVLALKAENIQAIEIKHPDKQIKIARTPARPEVKAEPSDTATDGEKPETAAPKRPAWQDAEGNEVPASDVKALLSSLSELKCKGFIDDRPKSDFSDPKVTITLSGPDTHTLSIFDKETADADKYPAVSSGSDEPFYLGARKAENIMEAIEKE